MQWPMVATVATHDQLKQGNTVGQRIFYIVEADTHHDAVHIVCDMAWRHAEVTSVQEDIYREWERP